MTQPLIGLDKLLANAWNVMFKEWRPTLGWTLGLVFLPLLLNIALGLPQIAEPALLENVAYNLVSVLVVFVVTIYFTIGLYRYFIAKIDQPTAKPEVRVSMKDVLTVLLISILSALILIPAFVLFIIPGIWLSIMLSMSIPVYLKEGKSAWASIKTSYGLVKGRWWATLVRFLVPNLVFNVGFGAVFGMIFFILFLVAGSIFGTAYAVLQNGADPSTALAAMGIPAVVSLGVGTLIMIILGIIMYILLALAQTSVWINLYKSLSETAEKK